MVRLLGLGREGGLLFWGGDGEAGGVIIITFGAWFRI